ncbi:glycosyltransferase family 2 protein [Enorma massiliensis]|uniref:Glycosyltransferase 2-like domain-containing protein n=1 Tax=Enorma massiliensis TaxID=1472761 RepID=A0A1Y3U1B5_9ACTN|nr:glycosyltransferase [Enorma massiliensis]OUN42602.1 hypothetical protein B5G21_07160 [Enorma massiliensis]
MSTVSVIVPNYNETDNLRSCLDSLLAQCYEGLEIVLVDDGSNEPSREICRDYSKNHPSIRLIETDNCGVSHARNIGIGAACGEYITFVDSDDMVKREHVRDLLMAITDSNADVAVCMFDYLAPRSGPESGTGLLDSANTIKVVNKSIAAELFAKTYGWFCWGKLYRRSLLVSSGIEFNEDVTVCEDLLFNLEVLGACNKVVLLDSAGYLYRQKGKSATNDLHNARWFDALDAYETAFHLASGNTELRSALSFNCELMLCEAKFRLKYLDYRERKTAEEKISHLIESLPSDPRYNVRQRAKLIASHIFPNLVMKIRRRGIQHD